MLSWSGRRREHGNRWPTLARLEDHAHGLTDPHRVEIAVDDVRHHRRAFLERDVGDDVGLGHSPHDAVRVDLAAARRRPPLGGVAAAERTDRAWIVVRLTARRALLDHEAAVGRRVPERLRLRRDRRRGELALRLSHGRHSLSMRMVSLAAGLTAAWAKARGPEHSALVYVRSTLPPIWSLSASPAASSRTRGRFRLRAISGATTTTAPPPSLITQQSRRWSGSVMIGELTTSSTVTTSRSIACGLCWACCDAATFTQAS